MKTLLPFVIILCCYYQMSAQVINADATIILNDNSIVNGTLKYADWEKSPDKIQFKPASESNYVTYMPGDLKSFLVNDVKYISSRVLTDNTPILTNDLYRELKYDTLTTMVFAKQLFSGKKSLYEYISSKAIVNYYIRNENDTLILLVYKRYIDDNSKIELVEKYKNQLSYYFSECMALLPELKDIKYTEASLIQIFKKYHQCIGAKSVQHTSEKLRYPLYLAGGLTYSSIKFTGAAEELFSGSTYPAAGSYTLLAGFGLPLAKKFQSRHIIAELGIKNLKISGNDSIAGGFGARYLTKIDLRYTYLKANLLYRQFFFPNNKVSLYAEAGFSLASAIKVRGDIKNLSNGLVYTQFNDSYRKDASYIIGAGATFKKIMGSIRYEHGNLFTMKNTVRLKVQTVCLLLGYRIF